MSLDDAAVANTPARRCGRLTHHLGLRRACFFLVEDDAAPVLCAVSVADGSAAHLRTGVAVRELLRAGTSATSVAEAGAVIARVGRSALECDHACAFSSTTTG